MKRPQEDNEIKRIKNMLILMFIILLFILSASVLWIAYSMRDIKIDSQEYVDLKIKDIKVVNGKDVYSAINRLEKRDDFNEMVQQIMDTDENANKRAIMRVKSKYVAMTEKALDTAAALLDEANEPDKTAADKAQAVRLANETFGAMSIVGMADPNPNKTPGVIDRKSHIL